VTREQVLRWIKKNPAHAAVISAGTVFVGVLAFVVVSIIRASGPSQSAIDRARQEPDICTRLKQLEALEEKDKRPLSPEQVSALLGAFRDLTHDEPRAEDALILRQNASSCSDLSSSDLAWKVLTEARVRHGVWPRFPEPPPQKQLVIDALLSAIDSQGKLSSLTVALPKNLDARQAWFRLALTQPGGAPLREAMIPKNATKDDLIAFSNEAAAIGESSLELVGALQERIGLLPSALYVRDEKPVTETPSLERAPDGTLRFVGALDDNRCVIALRAQAPVTLWPRPCAGLVPVRFDVGQLFLFGVGVASDGDARFVPVLVADDGDVRIGARLGLDARVLGAFIVSAARFNWVGGKLVTFAPGLSPVSAHDAISGETFAGFKAATPSSPQLLAFSGDARIFAPRKCAKAEKTRCEPVRFKDKDKNERCTLETPACFTLSGGAQVRRTRARLTYTEDCLREYGEKNDCATQTRTGVFIDFKSAGDATFREGPFVEFD
jgi:hypothetical protein